jgi:hypothetical protein
MWKTTESLERRNPPAGRWQLPTRRWKIHCMPNSVLTLHRSGEASDKLQSLRAAAMASALVLVQGAVTWNASSLCACFVLHPMRPAICQSMRSAICLSLHRWHRVRLAVPPQSHPSTFRLVRPRSERSSSVTAQWSARWAITAKVERESVLSQNGYGITYIIR